MISYIGSCYKSGHGRQISDTERIDPNQSRVLARFTADGRRPLRVLCATDGYPQLCETYMENEMGYVTKQGVELRQDPSTERRHRLVPIHTRGERSQDGRAHRRRFVNQGLSAVPGDGEEAPKT